MNTATKYIDKQNILNTLIITYAFLLPLSRAAVALFTPLIFLVWLYQRADIAIFKKLLENKTILSLLAFFLFALVSLLWTLNLSGGLNTLRLYLYLIVVFPLATIDKENAFKVISAFILGMFISIIVSYGVFFEFWTTHYSSKENPSPFMNHLQYSMFLAFTSLMLLNAIFFLKSNVHKILYALFFILTISNLFLNVGRTGQVTFFISLFILSIINIKNKLIALFGSVILLSSIIIFAYELSPLFKQRVTQASEEIQAIVNHDKNWKDGSFGQRISSWIVAKEIISEHPIKGVGIGSSMTVFREKITNEMQEYNTKIMKWYSEFHFHNIYISHLVQLGIIGLLINLSIFYYLIKLKIENLQLNNLKYIFASVFMISSMFEHMFFAQFPLALFGLFTGLFISQSTPIKQQVAK